MWRLVWTLLCASSYEEIQSLEKDEAGDIVKPPQRKKTVKRLLGGTQNLDIESVVNSEVETLCHIRHSNIVKIAVHRFAIAPGAAQDLAYMQHDCVPTIVHREVKCSNILLDEDFTPRAADFRLAKTLQQGAASTRDGLMSRVTKVTLSIPKVEGDGNCDSEHGRCYSDLAQLMDPRLKPSSSDYEEIEMLLNIAISCTSTLPINRPNTRRMGELLEDKKLSVP
ncbi:hypothetical protein NL676_022745 [Syzygium grande]|nr:hypothetical protein NL676_022745 [Syzygium grande]